jgi:DNA-binding beta-propeller fold protein YncE
VAGLVVVAGALLAPPASVAQLDSAERSVPAIFVRQLSLPGEGNDFLRPLAIHADRAFGEVLVADTGHGRVVIMDEQGTYKFEFGGEENFASPSALAVDSQGRIYVLGSTINGRIVQVFDFDGVFLRTMNTDTPDGPCRDITSIALDGSDNFYLLDATAMRVCSWDSAGRFRHSFDLIPDMEPDERRKQVFGAIEAHGDKVYVAASSLGTVAVYDGSGAFVRHIGYRGNSPGELSFPVDVAVQGDLVMVLDKHRYNVVCFDGGGRFLGEFGGKGHSPGWFYHPTLLEAGEQGLVYVGQIFQNKIQVCRIPEFILNGISSKKLGPNVRET